MRREARLEAGAMMVLVALATIPVLIGLIAGVFFLGTLVFATVSLATGSTTAAVVITAAGVLLFIALCHNKWEKNRRTYASLIEKTDFTISVHEKTLVRKRLQTFHLDDYGKPVSSNWYKEINYFIDDIVRPSLDKHGVAVLDRNTSEVMNYVESKIAPLATAHELAFDADMSPLEFEHFCAQQLRSAGWSAMVTKASGDQGSDVIADKDSLRLIWQCKLYDRPVGNKAVQEVSAARLHEQADYAAVLSNASYTASARRLALTNNVLLLYHPTCSLSMESYRASTQAQQPVKARPQAEINQTPEARGEPRP